MAAGISLVLSAVALLGAASLLSGSQFLPLRLGPSWLRPGGGVLFKGGSRTARIEATPAVDERDAEVTNWITGALPRDWQMTVASLQNWRFDPRGALWSSRGAADQQTAGNLPASQVEASNASRPITRLLGTQGSIAAPAGKTEGMALSARRPEDIGKQEPEGMIRRQLSDLGSPWDSPRLGEGISEDVADVVVPTNGPKQSSNIDSGKLDAWKGAAGLPSRGRMLHDGAPEDGTEKEQQQPQQQQQQGQQMWRRHRRSAEGCWSRSEQKLYYKEDAATLRSEALSNRLLSYGEMHRRCTARVRDWLAFFADQSAGIEEGADISGCKYLLFDSPMWHGVGNRIMGLVSAFVFALLTDRALLLPDNLFLARAFCNPFPDSTWLIPGSQFGSLIPLLKHAASEGKALEHHLSWDSQNFQVLCDREQGEVEGRTWGIMYTDFFLVPAFYLAKRHQEALDSLFPDRRVFFHAARYMLLPANHLWDRVTRAFDGYLGHHSTCIGVQIRETKDTGVGVMANVLDCLVNKTHYLPDTVSPREWRQLALQTHDERLRAFPRNTVGVLVTSLNGQHASLLHDRYTRGKPVDGSAVSVHVLSHDAWEKQEDYGHYESATVEMWLLSLSDKLLTSDYSTFGYVASGLAGLNPYTMNVAIRGSEDHMDWRRNGRESCEPSFSEPCLGTDLWLTCSPDEPSKSAYDLAPEHLTWCPGVGRHVALKPLQGP